MEKMRKSGKMEELARRVISENQDDLGWIEWDDVKITYLLSNSAKKTEGHRVFGECKKCDPILREVGDCDFVIIFYDPNIKGFTDRQLYILMHHELLHASVRDGKPAIIPHDYIVGDFKQIIDKYGIDWAKAAGNVEAEPEKEVGTDEEQTERSEQLPF